ncbi:hypothetical protein [Bradyrhizobium sp. CCBAU 45321]|uniref:hypothetical protein n=1 Tax=Bradyrhizobium sp. CCBAU 45321 TaxID=1641878 RepID=UPI00230219F5|nr:hypothetical protein [Bradyrhizobium sp. CCBAU 45321]
MAKNSTVKSGGPARVRLVVFDAEVPDGDFNSLAQVLQNALKTPTVIQQPRMTNGAAAKTITHHPAEAAQDDEPGLFDHLDEEEAVEATPAPAKPRAPRKAPKAPDVVDIDMNSDVSLATFAAGKDAGSQHKKYMIAAAWLKEHRGIDAVSAGHIYTCFRSMEWSANIPDFWQPLRDLKAKKYFAKNDAGDYEINHLGLDFVKKLGGNGAG